MRLNQIRRPAIENKQQNNMKAILLAVMIVPLTLIAGSVLPRAPAVPEKTLWVDQESINDNNGLKVQTMSLFNTNATLVATPAPPLTCNHDVYRRRSDLFASSFAAGVDYDTHITGPVRAPPWTVKGNTLTNKNQA